MSFSRCELYFTVQHIKRGFCLFLIRLCVLWESALTHSGLLWHGDYHVLYIFSDLYSLCLVCCTAVFCVCVCMCACVRTHCLLKSQDACCRTALRSFEEHKGSSDRTKSTKEGHFQRSFLQPWASACVHQFVWLRDDSRLWNVCLSAWLSA